MTTQHFFWKNFRPPSTLHTPFLGGVDHPADPAQASSQYEPNVWCLGSEGLRQELLAQVSHLARPAHTGEDIRQAVHAKAEKIVEQELHTLGWSAEALKQRRKGDAYKVRSAVRLRKEATMPLHWIAERPHMGKPVDRVKQTEGHLRIAPQLH